MRLLLSLTLVVTGCARVGFEPTVEIGDPIAGDPTPGDQAASGDEAGAGDPGVGDPGAGDPGAGDPGISLPSPTTDPAVRDPGAPPTSVSFNWSSLTDATSYDFTVGTSPTCPGTDTLTELGDTTIDLDAAELAADTTYYWCVRGVGPDGPGAWSTPSRIGTYGWRLRLVEQEPLASIGYVNADTVVPWQDGNVLHHPLIQFSWGSARDRGWQLDPAIGRWRIVDQDPGQPEYTRDGVLGTAYDPGRDVSYSFLGLEPGKVLEEPTFARFDAATATWSEIVLDDANVFTTCGGMTMTFDPTQDVVVVLLRWCEPPDTERLIEIDVAQDPAVVQQVTVTGMPQLEQPAMAVDPASGQLVVADSSLYRVDLETGTWTLSTSTRMLDVMVTTRDRLLAVDDQELLRFETDDWVTVPTTSVPTLDSWWVRAPVALAPDPTSLWFAVSGGSASQNALAAIAMEPGDRPILVLSDPATASTDGTTSSMVDLTITEDIDAVAWLVRETAGAPSASDPDWQTQRPTSWSFIAPGDGLVTLYLWVRYENGEVSEQPATASIWRLSTPVVAPAFVLRDPETGGAAGAGVTTSNCIVAVITGETAGLTRLLASTDPTTPVEADFRDESFPAVDLCGAPPGPTTVYAWALDAVGNVVSLGSVDGTFIDVWPPSLSAPGDRLVSAGEVLTWTSTDPSAPITYDVRLSTAAGCAGDLDTADGISVASYSLPGTLLPGNDYWFCVRALDGWNPANASVFRESQLRYQASSARWFPLASMPIANGYATATAYDTARGRLLVFGGFDGNYHRAVYAYDSAANSWSGPISTSGTAPSGRALSRAFYDAPRDRMIVYGGFFYDGNDTTYYGETFALDLTTDTWSNSSPSGDPGGRREFSSVLDPSGLWVVSPGAWGDGNYSRTYLFDPVSVAWSEAAGVSGLSRFGGTLVATPTATWIVTSNRTYTYDPIAGSSTEIGTITGQLTDAPAVVDPYTGRVVSYLENCVETAEQTRRTYLFDPGTEHRTLTDADNIFDRCDAGLALDPVRRSVLLVAGYTETSPNFTRTAAVHEFRINGGPRVFASDPGTQSESVVSGPSVDLAVDWDEPATAWLVNETEWPPPPAGAVGWQGSRPASYTFPDGTLGDRTIFVWIKDGGGAVVEDAGRWTITRQ